MKELVTVIAGFRAKSGREQEVEQVLQGMVAPTRAEPGCVRYDLYRAGDAEGNFSLFEIYESTEALEHHRKTDHYKAYRARIGDLLEGPIEVRVLRAIDAAV